MGSFSGGEIKEFRRTPWLIKLALKIIEHDISLIISKIGELNLSFF